MNFGKNAVCDPHRNAQPKKKQETSDEPMKQLQFLHTTRTIEGEMQPTTVIRLTDNNPPLVALTHQIIAETNAYAAHGHVPYQQIAHDEHTYTVVLSEDDNNHVAFVVEVVPLPIQTQRMYDMTIGTIVTVKSDEPYAMPYQLRVKGFKQSIDATIDAFLDAQTEEERTQIDFIIHAYGEPVSDEDAEHATRYGRDITPYNFMHIVQP